MNSTPEGGRHEAGSAKPMIYDTNLLRTFVAVCDSGSFTKAAREANLTQAAVSLHVNRLEEQIGSCLILRSSRNLRLTEQGEILLSYARRILALNREAERRLNGKDAGSVRIGAPEYFDLRTLSSLLARFADHHPEIQLQIELGIGPDIAALLDAGELDLAIINREIGEGDGISLCRERRVWAANRTMQLNPSKPVPLALYPPHCGWRQLAFDRLNDAGRAWTVVLQSAGTAGILAALDAGLAISLFPEHCLPDSLKAMDSSEGLPTLPDFEFVLRRNRNSPEMARHLADTILSFFQLTSALRPGVGMNYQERSNLLV
ncbi:MAG TPA: LysR substrate-binding domain-containing protein [Methylocella sp.]|nr:LysR substrate-binding domain-containing protein [Methylocella sp.]